MALAFSITNILQFFTFVSPIFITTFLLLQSAMQFNIKGLVYLLGIIISYFLGILVKTFFYKTGNKRFLRRLIGNDIPLHAGQTLKGLPDYCSVFEDPFFSSTVGITGMPSMTAIFHAFTFAYILSGVISNPHHPGIPLVIVLGLTALIHFGFRVSLFCDRWSEIAVGIILGGLFGFLWWLLINSWDPRVTYYGKEDNIKKCKLTKTKFRCVNNS